MAPIFGYWNLRGLGQSTRFLLEYINEAYEQKSYEMGSAPDYDTSSWTSVKHTLGLDLPNLPYYIDGDVKLTQSHAILRYLGMKHNLCGQTEKEKIMNDMLMDQAKDLRVQFFMITYLRYNDPKARKEFAEKMDQNLKELSAILGNQKWFTGDKIAVADFLLYEEIYVNLILNHKCLDDYQNLQVFKKRFEDLPAIKKYMASPRYIKSPINGTSAKFTG